MSKYLTNKYISTQIIMKQYVELLQCCYVALSLKIDNVFCYQFTCKRGIFKFFVVAAYNLHKTS